MIKYAKSICIILLMYNLDIILKIQCIVVNHRH